VKAALLSDQQRLESESDATIVETERLIAMLAAGASCWGEYGLSCWAREFPGR